MGSLENAITAMRPIWCKKILWHVLMQEKVYPLEIPSLQQTEYTGWTLYCWPPYAFI
jgi:hypothetical protein